MIEQILQADRLLQVDQVDRAREMYERVVEMDPHNAIAVVGVARCAVAEGDDERAYELAARALEIDPENDMARRMEARLSEILATRGREVDRPPVAATPGSRELRPVMTADGGVTPAPPHPRPTPVSAPAKPTPAAKEPVVRKSFLDRLLGR